VGNLINTACLDELGIAVVGIGEDANLEVAAWFGFVEQANFERTAGGRPDIRAEATALVVIGAMLLCVLKRGHSGFLSIEPHDLRRLRCRLDFALHRNAHDFDLERRAAGPAELGLNGIGLAEHLLAEPDQHGDVAGACGLHLEVANFGAAHLAAFFVGAPEFRLFEAFLKSVVRNSEASCDAGERVHVCGEIADFR